MELPVEISWENRAGSKRQAKGTTGNISGSGLLIESPTRLPNGTSIMIKVQLPPAVTKAPMELWCQARVVRGKQHSQSDGVGAVIDEYELRPVSPVTSRGKRPRGSK